ncbi:spore maturation protein [Cuneatibacter caecimuris]|uniref:Spore maturation protein B n=1 Tax=Cuneatibacter caecimuris TaxID=1796618 RepID=A0A4Q7P3E1_9FIRM|nr:nucleoside recognition domain-containing protein [Cuneatibacter caecimuris]RZS94446.1 spore maturation protein B [Cuneatibacter caecimuris]
MGFIVYLSNFMIPLLFFYVIATGVAGKVPVYDVFVRGAKEGMKTVAGILPTLVGLMVAVGMLRASGFLDFLAQALSGPCEWLGLPAPLVPLTIVRMFSSSAATGLVLDLFRQFGPDSHIGLIAGLLVSCTETIFYTMSVYFMTAKVKKTRYTLAGAMVATLAGVIASVVIAGMIQ